MDLPQKDLFRMPWVVVQEGDRYFRQCQWIPFTSLYWQLLVGDLRSCQVWRRWEMPLETGAEESSYPESRRAISPKEAPVGLCWKEEVVCCRERQGSHQRWRLTESKRANLCFTCWEGHEEVTLPKGAVLVQEMFRIELVWVWKLFTVVEDRSEDRVYRGALK